MQAEMQTAVQPPASWPIRVWRSAPVRIVVGVAMLALVPIVFSNGLKLAARLFPAFDALLRSVAPVPGVSNRPLAFYIVTLAIVLLSIPVYRLFVRWTERRAAPEVAFDGALWETVAGMLFGTALFSCAVLVLWSGGHYRAAPGSSIAALAPVVAMSAAAAVMEELMFRGVIFRILEQWAGTRIALGVSALLFGVVHLGNPNANLQSAVAIAIEAGVLLGVAYMVTRRLWLVMGVHFAWNFTQGGVFGIPVSGIRVPGLLEGTLTGPEWLTGGPFGVEASVVAIVVCLGGTALLWRAAQVKRAASKV